jgi:hypothetical protein
MTAKFRCPNGHKLRFDEQDSGKNATCPTCHARFVLPNLSPQVSDTSIMAILGGQPADHSIILHPSATPHTAVSTKMCPKCKARIGVRYQICPHCRTYLPLSKH